MFYSHRLNIYKFNQLQNKNIPTSPPPKFQTVPKSQTWIFCVPGIFHTAFTLYLHILVSYLLLLFSRSVLYNSFQPDGLGPTRFLCPWGLSRQEYWSGLLWKIQRIFPTQVSNPGLPHCRWILYCLSHQGSPRILKWVAYLFSRGSSRTGISCIASRVFTTIYIVLGILSNPVWASQVAQW